MVMKPVKFNSSYGEEKIFEEILNEMTDDDLTTIVKSNKYLRARAKVFNIKNIKVDRSLFKASILQLYKTNEGIRLMVIANWKLSVAKEKAAIERYEDINKIKKHIATNKNKFNMFNYATILMTLKEEDLNKLGDEIFTDYINNNYEKDEDDEELFGEDDMFMENKEFLSMNLGELIEKLSEYKCMIENLEQKLVKKDKEFQEIISNKDKELKQLKKELKEATSGKGVKSQIKQIEVAIEEQQKNNTKELSKIVENNKIFEDNITGFMKDIKLQNKTLTSSMDANKLSKEISSTLVLTINKKVIGEQSKSIKDELNLFKKEILEEIKNNILKEINVQRKENKNKDAKLLEETINNKQQKRNNNTAGEGVTVFDTDIENLFGEIKL